MILPGAYSQKFGMKGGLIPGNRERGDGAFHIKQFFTIHLQIA